MNGADMGIKSFHTRLSQQREARIMKYISVFVIISVVIAIKLTYSANTKNNASLFLKLEPKNGEKADKTNDQEPDEIGHPNSKPVQTINAADSAENKVQSTKAGLKPEENQNFGKKAENGTKPLLDKKEALETLRERMKGRNVSTFTCDTCMILTKYMSELLEKGFTEKAIGEFISSITSNQPFLVFKFAFLPESDKVVLICTGVSAGSNSIVLII